MHRNRPVDSNSEVIHPDFSDLLFSKAAIHRPRVSRGPIFLNLFRIPPAQGCHFFFFFFFSFFLFLLLFSFFFFFSFSVLRVGKLFIFASFPLPD